MISTHHKEKKAKIQWDINKSFSLVKNNLKGSRLDEPHENIELWLGSFQLPIKSIQLSSKFQRWAPLQTWVLRENHWCGVHLQNHLTTLDMAHHRGPLQNKTHWLAKPQANKYSNTLTKYGKVSATKVKRKDLTNENLRTITQNRTTGFSFF